jgi:cysteine-rich repeat protein
MHTMFSSRVVIAATVVAGVVLGSQSCGGDDPFCGNGKVEASEQCDDGNADDTDACRSCQGYIAPRTTITWDFNNYPERGFSGDACNETGVASVQVEISGPVTKTVANDCPKRQVVFLDLPPGQYRVAMIPLDANGASKVNAPVLTQVTAGATNTQIDVNVPFESWATAYTGLFLYRLSWGSQTCSTATPPVVTQTLTFTPRLQVGTSFNDLGQKLDGTDDKPCRELTADVPQNIADVPFGPATMDVVGKDAMGVVQFHKTFDTFVGVGQVNPTLVFDVPTPDAAMPVDAATDAPLDAAMP